MTKSSKKFRQLNFSTTKAVLLLLALTIYAGVAAAVPTSAPTLARNYNEDTKETDGKVQDSSVIYPVINKLFEAGSRRSETNQDKPTPLVRRIRTSRHRRSRRTKARSLSFRDIGHMKSKCSRLYALPLTPGQSAIDTFLRNKDWFCRICPMMFGRKRRC